MLVLSRKKHETIVIGQNIRVTVVEIEAGKIRLGISATADVSIHRLEVFDAIKEKEREAGA